MRGLFLFKGYSMFIVVIIWCFLVILFAWFGKDSGPIRVFKALGYASATLIIPATIIVGGFLGLVGFYQDAVHERAWAEKAPERAAAYDACVAKSKDAAAKALADKQAGNGEYVTDVELLRALNGCPSK
jgi:hypothetical protein